MEAEFDTTPIKSAQRSLQFDASFFVSPQPLVLETMDESPLLRHIKVKPATRSSDILAKALT